MAPHRDLGVGAEDGLFEFHVDVFAQVGAALSAAAPRVPPPPPKISPRPKKSPKMSPEIGGVEARAAASAEAGVAEAVVDAALLAIRQYRVSFAALFEFFFRVGIIGVAVGMELQRQFAIGALDLLLGGGAGDAQHLVVVAFSVAGQNGLSQILSVYVALRGSVLGVARDPHHRRTQQAVFQLVATLQLVEHMMIFGFFGVHHFNGLVKMRIKRLTLGRDRRAVPV